MRRDGGSVFPAQANTGDPNGPLKPMRLNAKRNIGFIATVSTRALKVASLISLSSLLDQLG